jgi:nucleoside-diphosphate-sugar epimerase
MAFMRIALTGVSGFIGSVIAKRLVANGHQVTGLIRRSSRRDHIEPVIDRFVFGDQADETSWPDLLDGAECVIHSSIDRSAFEQDDAHHHYQSNLVGSLRFLDASAPRQFIYISSIAVHHDMLPRWKGIINEDHPLRPAHLYGALKASVEAHLWAAHFGDGRNTCAHRPCAVYGIDPDLERSHGYELIQKLLRNEPIRKPGGGKFVHVDDVASAVVATVGNPGAAGKPFNHVDCYARWADWAVIAADLLGVRADIDLSSPPEPENMFTKEAVNSLGVEMNRGHEGIREHLRQLIDMMAPRTAASR